MKNTPARFQLSAESRLATAEQEIAAAQKLQRSAPLEPIGKYLTAVEAASIRLREQPKDAAALRDYKLALARVFSCIRAAGIDAWPKSITARFF